MIHVSRNNSVVPRVFASPALADERQKAAEFFQVDAKERAQRWFEWDRTLRLLSAAKAELARLFNGKCAYCERELSRTTRSGLPELEHFRPIAGAMNHDGAFAPDHYWWLAFEWKNLLGTCSECNVTKGKRFPVEGSRSRVAVTRSRHRFIIKAGPLQREKPLLLDPCTDHPEEHLVFGEDGRVASRTERGRITIEVLALNREPLVGERRARIQQLRALVEALRQHTSADGTEMKPEFVERARALGRFLSPRSPFLAAARQCFQLWVREFGLKPQISLCAEKAGGRLVEHLSALVVRVHGMSRADVEATQSDFQSHLQRKEQHSVEAQTPAAKAAYFGGARRIERIEIHNFRSIRHLELVMPAQADQEAWLMLIGENGTGKSSVLQAVALALLGQQHINKLGLDAREFVNHDRDNKERAGWVRVHLTNVSIPVELRFSRFSKKFTVNPPSELVLLFGYGATRLLPRSVTTKDKPTRYIRVKNLFNPYARLHNAERWLTDRQRLPDSRFGPIARAIKKLLLLEKGDEIRRERRRIIIRAHGRSNTLGELSDGYQSVVALATDIMIGLADKWDDISAAEGVVLVDEIEAHLHPRWKMEIVSRLRSVFPKLAFICTTHDPLSLRGLEPGEIAVLRRTADQRLDVQIVAESIAHLRADQLLTSPLFGLPTTRDVEVKHDLDRFSELFSMAVRTPKEEMEFKSLESKLAGSIRVGETPAARIVEAAMGKAIGEIMLPDIKARLSSPAFRGQLHLEQRKALAELFGQAPAPKRGKGKR